MTSTALLALDQGTSTTRAALFREGRMVEEVRREVRLSFPSPGRAEQDSRELVAAALSALEDVAAMLDQGEPAALGLTGQRSTIILWDGENGRPFGPALSWRDSRARDECAALARSVPDLEHRTGLPASPHYGAAKLKWALHHWPEARAAEREGRLRVGPVTTWLLWKLSHGRSFFVDPTNAQRMQALDLATLDWDPRLLDAVGVGTESLPRVLPTDGDFGDVSIGAHSMPVRAMLGDQQAAVLGLRLPADGASAGVQLGTGGFVLRDVGTTCLRVPGLLSGIARADANRARRYLVEGPVSSAGSAFDRLRDMGLLLQGETLDGLVAQAARPLAVVPAWAGLAAPWWQPSAQAAIFGWDESSTRADLVAGTVRGVAFLVADIVDVMQRARLEVRELHLSGPLSGVACLGQALADATQLKIRIRPSEEASLEGIALALAESCGVETPVRAAEADTEIAPGPFPALERAAFIAARDAVIGAARA